MCKPEEIIKSCDVTNYIISKLGHSPNGMKSTKYAVIGIISIQNSKPFYGHWDFLVYTYIVDFN
jgi:hypothetical protein